MSSRGESGFTLIEILVGTTILAMMMTLLAGALFTMTRTARAGDRRLEAADDARLVQAFLRTQLMGAAPLTEVDGTRQRMLFDGGPDSLVFVAHLPAHRGGGGLQFAELSAEPTSDTRTLVLRYRDAWPETPFVETGEGAAQIEELAKDVDGVRFRYYGARDDDSSAAWSDNWKDAERLPALIEVDVQRVGAGRWPRIVAPVSTRTAIAQTRLFRLRSEVVR